MPLQTKIKLYIILSLVIYMVNLVSIFVLNTYMGSMASQVEKNGLSLIQFLNKITIFILALSLAAVIYGVYTYISTFLKGVNRYRDLSRRVTSLLEQEDFNLKSIEFPKEDEFGNLGNDFNVMLSKLFRFDELKTQRMKIEKQKFEYLAERTETPILVVGIERDDKIVKYYNATFEHVFAKKGDEGQYYDIKNFFLKALVIEDKPKEQSFSGVLDIFNRISESEMIYSFIDKEFDDAINIAIADRNETEIRKDIRTMRGDEVYHSEHIEIIPLWDDYGRTHDVVIFFNKLKKVK